MKDVKNVFNPKKRTEVEDQSSLIDTNQSKKEEDSTSDSGQGSIDAGDLKSPNQNSKTNDDLSDMDLLTSDEEEVWNPFMELQEPPREVNILNLPKVEQEEDGLTVTLSDTFERFHSMGFRL